MNSPHIYLVALPAPALEIARQAAQQAFSAGRIIEPADLNAAMTAAHVDAGDCAKVGFSELVAPGLLILKAREMPKLVPPTPARF